jgi:biopolymer transport protein ExbD
MIDVVFLLLIYFIVTHKEELSEAHLAVNLPDPQQGQPTVERVDLLQISVRPGLVALNGRIMTPEQLREQLADFAELDSEQTVIVKVDGKATNGELVRVLDLCRGANLTQLNVVSM